MKFTELHIAVVTFHPLEFIFLLLVLSYAWVTRKERKGEKKEKEREDKKERNKTRENTINRETKGENMGTTRNKDVYRIKERKIREELRERRQKCGGKKETWRGRKRER